MSKWMAEFQNVQIKDSKVLKRGSVQIKTSMIQMILNCLFILYLHEQDSSLCLGERERTEKDRETDAYKERYRETEMEMREREQKGAERSKDIQTHTEAERKITKRIDL